MPHYSKLPILKFRILCAKTDYSKFLISVCKICFSPSFLQTLSFPICKTKQFSLLLQTSIIPILLQIELTTIFIFEKLISARYLTNKPSPHSFSSPRTVCKNRRKPTLFQTAPYRVCKNPN